MIRVSVLLPAMLLAACESTNKAPVSVIDPTPLAEISPTTTYSGRMTIVKPGDNLYSISFESGFNYLEVAEWNDIDPEDFIHPGQEIKLYPPENQTAPRTTTQSTSSPTQDTQPAAKPQSTPAASTASIPSTPVSDWIWPAEGEIIAKFSAAQRRNGIEIAGQNGSPIRVAASGRVVYSGTGLIGYGRIIIVKHNTSFLSVYAHNSRVVVKEGDSVKRGQKIAEMGSTDTDRVKLHFEIRHNGKPVDPLRYLPKG